VRLREEVRAFLQANPPPSDPVRRANCWQVCDAAFTRALGRAGYIGMTWPKRYGGHERHPLERYIVLEELLAAGAPVGLSWLADRQSGPLLLRFGTETQRERFLAPIAQGELYFCIGMSEPNSGSDLASVSTRAVRDGDGWRIQGHKLWTTNAHRAQMMIALVRSGENSKRQEGLSQFIIDLRSPGITVRPVIDLVGGHDFNEVFFDNVFVLDDMRLGEAGSGWHQVTAELSLERSGPERYLSSLPVFLEFLRAVGPNPDPILVNLIGRLSAELWAIRQMSMAVAAKLAVGEDPMVEASIVKDLGTTFEQEMPRLIQAQLDDDLAADTDLARVLAHLLQISPSFSLRGGTREILRGIIARGLGLR
jgi:hypothetical protein